MAARTANTADKAEARRQLAADLHARIGDQVSALVESDKWLAYLDAARSLHTYSLNNVLLMLAQRPDATQVAGFRAWQQRGRQVRKGERAIRIFGYSSRTVTDTDTTTGEETRRKVPTYPVLSVFDIDQTDPIEGHPQPDPIAAHLTGADEHGIYERVRDVMIAQGWSVERAAIPGQTNGYTTLDGAHRIVVDADLAPAQAARTMIHEAAHAMMHATGDIDPAELHRGRSEVEAESVAYVLSGLLGLDASDYSVGYIAGWAEGDTDTITDTARTVLATVHTLAEALTPTATEATDESETEHTAA
ncbi:ArdC-like ssDNA-binding domain-containing protein [Rhodococcus sp. NPDC019627]|uniref:ArdC-like ssDNA-binding domain-containing protein n=1 Tax=unclassified Rhodococcus (in: high G+C Gram-positive bacteria) TaxID=192944 RepID=UPI0033E8F9CD